jgi:hypothetical protein
MSGAVKRGWLWIAVAAIVLVFGATALGASRSASTSPSPTPSTRSVEPAGPTSASSPLALPSASPSPGPSAGPSASPSPGTLEPLGVLLSMLRISPEDRAGYARSLFVHWIDADGNGCDTRREVLIAEAVVKPRVGPRCALSGGRWMSLYDGRSFTDPSKLQIDHVVPLAEAWDSGASTWTPSRREAFANDLDAPFALIAVSASSNQSKSDRDPADWLPPAASDECPYLGAWIATKVRWDLAVDPRERDALAADIGDCPTTTMAYLPAGSAGEGAGATAPPGSAGPTASGGECDPAYPTVCIAPPPPDLDCADVPFRDFQVLPPDPHRFDGDGDGIGCEG